MKIAKHFKIIGKVELLQKVHQKCDFFQTYDVNCYFPVHTNCRVTLYQDTNVPLNLVQFTKMHLPPGKSYYPLSCWKDLYYSLVGAKEIICINGWSVWHKLKLLRGADLGIDRRTLGQILIDKANEGVKVYVMVWSDRSGMQGTHDVETYNYFKKSKVSCVTVAR